MPAENRRKDDSCWFGYISGKKAYYHKTCYQSFTRDFLSNRNAEEQSIDECSEKVTIDLFILPENPDIIELQKITGILESQMREERIKSEAVINSARTSVKRRLLRKFFPR